MIRRALISVSDKTGLMPLARALNRRKVEILSTGGTAALLRKQGIPVTEVSKFTGFPEILSGRVKTLHPKVHGGILQDRGSREHRAQAKRLGLKAIDLVVVSLYPFEVAARRKNAPLAELIEQIDIGGVALIRSAAKNFKSVGILCRPEQYAGAIAEIEKKGTFSEMSLFRLAVEAFAESSYYDAVIHQALAHREKKNKGTGYRNGTRYPGFPERMVLGLSKRQELRYGENPHQSAVWYQWAATGGLPGGLAGARQLHGKELSFNNLLDLDAVLRLVFAFKKPAAAVVKHSNPCGVACAATLTEAFRWAFAGDPLSVFGGIVGLNRSVDAVTARAIVAAGFLECVVASGYRPGALKVLKGKKNLRVIEVPRKMPRECLDFRQVGGGLLAQQPDEIRKGLGRWRVATKARPTASQKKDLLFAWTVARFVKSNAIVIAKDSQAVGIGMGLTSRVDSVAFALKKAGPRARGAVLASDGFFPKPDGPALAVRAGIRAIVQPGGSIQDPEVIRVAQKARIAMVLTGERHFKH